jgi:hypothetical protein
MSIRYLTNMLLALVAATLVVFTMAFAPGVAATLTFAFAIALTVIGAASLIAPTGIVQRVIGGIVAVIGAWTIVASLVFAAPTVLWLGFAAGAAAVGLAVIGLTVHELTTERVVHSLEVGQRASARPEYAQEREAALAA